MSLNTIPEIIEDIRAGKMVILMDDEDRARLARIEAKLDVLIGLEREAALHRNIQTELQFTAVGSFYCAAGRKV